MDTLTTHPATAQQAKAFTSATSLSYPGGADFTPPSSESGSVQPNANSQQQNGQAAPAANGVTPDTPAATPAAGQAAPVSGIVPTLQ